MSSDIVYYTLDTETTGLSTSMHEIFEISIIRNKDRLQLTRQIKCEFPQNASLDALRITGKTKADLYYGMSKEDAIKDCNRFFNEDGLTPAHRCVIAHNSSFDHRFVVALWDKCNLEFPCDLWVDTMAMSRDMQKNKGIVKPKVSLADSCNSFNIVKKAGQHAAKVDTQNCYLLYNKLITEAGLDHLKYIKNLPHRITTNEDIDDMLKELDNQEEND